MGKEYNLSKCFSAFVVRYLCRFLGAGDINVALRFTKLLLLEYLTTRRVRRDLGWGAALKQIRCVNRGMFTLKKSWLLAHKLRSGACRFFIPEKLHRHILLMINVEAFGKFATSNVLSKTIVSIYYG